MSQNFSFQDWTASYLGVSSNAIGNAYKSALTAPNLMSAFRKTGIVPFNPDVILAKPIDPLRIKKHLYVGKREQLSEQ